MASISEDESVMGKLSEIKRLLSSFDKQSTDNSTFKRGQRRIKEIVKELDDSDLTLDGVPLTRHQIELNVYGRTAVYVFNTSLVGKKTSNADFTGGTYCMFDCGDGKCTAGNMKQKYPEKQDFGDSQYGVPPAFRLWVGFITKLMSAVEVFEKKTGEQNVTLSASIAKSIGHQGVTPNIAQYLDYTNKLTKEEFAASYSKARGTKKRGAKKRGAKKRGAKKRGTKKRGTKKRGSRRR